MTTLTEEALTQKVIASFDKEGSERLKEIVNAIVRHAHAAVREANISHQEWLEGMNFLVSAGQYSNDERNEIILLSDSLGISAMVDILSDNAREGESTCTGLGPFYIPGQAMFENGSSINRIPVPGEPMLFSGRVETPEGRPQEGVIVEVWQCHAEGLYDLQEDQVPNMRGRFSTDANGEFSYVSVLPEGYPLPEDGPVRPLNNLLKTNNMRPAHIHLMVHREGQAAYVTHLFPSVDRYLDTDPVYGARDDLLMDFERVSERRGDEPLALPEGTYYRGEFCFVLKA